jgi:hypothetical protein
MTNESILCAIINKYGEQHQLTVVVEELAELTKEITKRIRSGGNAVKISEELADVEIVLAQLKLMMPETKTRVPMYKHYKMQRLKVIYIDGGER